MTNKDIQEEITNICTYIEILKSDIMIVLSTSEEYYTSRKQHLTLVKKLEIVKSILIDL